MLCLPEENEATSVLAATLALVLDLSVLVGVIVLTVLLLWVLLVVAVDATNKRHRRRYYVLEESVWL